MAFEVKIAQTLRVRNPWPGAAVRITEARSGRTVHDGRDAVLTFPVRAGAVYPMEPAGQADGGFAPISGQPEDPAKMLGPARIGLQRVTKVGGAVGTR